MSLAAEIMHYGFVVSVLATLALSILGIRWKRALVLGRWAAVAATAFGAVGIALRWYLTGHPPLFGTFENTYLLAWSLMVGAAVASFVSARLVGLWRWAAPWAMVALLYGLGFRSDPVPLTISEQSLWVDVHVVFAWIALVSFLGVTSLAAVRRAGRKPLGMDGEDADRLAADLLMIGFAGFTCLLATGSWYSYILFGVFWQWEIVETLSLVVWISYGIVIHGRLFYRWSGRTLDIAVLLVLPALLAAYFVWSIFPGTYHYFDIPLVKPY